MTATPTAPEEKSLLGAVHDLTTEVKALRELLTKDYPKRAEVREDGRQKVRQLIVFTLVTLLLAQLMTMTTISTCFLNASDRAPSACNAMPGYRGAVEQGQIRLQRFYELANSIEENKVRSEEAKAKVAELEIELEKLKQKR